MTVHILGGMDTPRAGQARDSQLQGGTKGGGKMGSDKGLREIRKALTALGKDVRRGKIGSASRP